MKRLAFTIFLCFIYILTVSCSKGESIMDFNDEYTVTCDLDYGWNGLLQRNPVDYGWLCADGIYTVALDGNDRISSASENTKTLFIFSDTLIGKTDSRGKILDSCWANHTAAVLEGNVPDSSKMTFYYGLNGSMDTKNNTNLFDLNQWLFDCFVINGRVHILAFTQEIWKPVRIDIIEIPLSEELDPLFDQYTRRENITQLLKKTSDKDYAYGIGIMNNTDEAGVEKADGYIYFYGYIDNYASGIKDLIVSRIHKNDLEDFSNLRYWNGTDWSDNIEESAVILENVSCEMSVNYVNDGPFAGKYLAVYTQRVESERIMYAVGDSPTGPFSEPVLAYTAPEYRKKLEIGQGDYYTYNAKAHPHLSGDGSLLITYNVNVRDGDAVRTEDYIPRFLKLSWN